MNKAKAKIIIFYIWGTLTSTILAEPVQLIEIWKDAITYDNTIQQAKNNLNIESVRNRYKFNIYTPELSLGSSSNLEDYLASNIDFSFPLPGGLNISLPFSYAVNEIENSGNIQYGQTGSLGFSISQSFEPYWLQRQISGNPEINQRLDELRLSEVIVADITKNGLLKISEYVIQLRKVCRQIDYLKHSLAYQEEMIESYRTLQMQGIASRQRVWALEQNLWDDETQLQNLEEEKGDLQLILKQSTGVIFDDILQVQLPNDNEIDNFFSEIIEVEDSSREILDIQRKINRNQQSIRIQQNAPTISVNFLTKLYMDNAGREDYFGVWSDSYFDDWSLSIVLDLSPMLSSKNKSYQLIEALKDELLIDRIARETKQIESSVSILNSDLESLKYNKERIETSLNYAQSIYEDMNGLFQNETISSLDLQGASLEVYKRKNLLANIEDSIWEINLNLHWIE